MELHSFSLSAARVVVVATQSQLLRSVLRTELRQASSQADAIMTSIFAGNRSRRRGRQVSSSTVMHSTLSCTQKFGVITTVTLHISPLASMYGTQRLSWDDDEDFIVLGLSGSVTRRFTLSGCRNLCSRLIDTRQHSGETPSALEFY